MDKVTITQAAEILGVFRTVIQHHIKTRRLPADLQRVGRVKYWLIDRKDLELIKNLKPGPQKSDS